MQIAGSPDDLALSGWDGAADSGRPLFALGDVDTPADVRFAASGDGRLIAPAGEVLWRRAPWPVHDALFDLDPPADARRVLVVGRAEVAERLRAIGVDVDERARLTVDALRAAAVVVLVAGNGALPAHAPCVLAARRLLVTDAGETTFGLQPGIDYLRAATSDEAVERANIGAVHPDATASLRALGARAAREHRASLVYPRLAADLAAG